MVSTAVVETSRKRNRLSLGNGAFRDEAHSGEGIGPMRINCQRAAV
jgi:hypothetical protein